MLTRTVAVQCEFPVLNGVPVRCSERLKSFEGVEMTKLFCHDDGQ